MWLIVGLGNPGREYAGHRHNVGFMVLDELASRSGAEAFRAKFSGEIARTELRGEDALLLKPMTYMNLSGDSVQPCAAFFKIPVDRVVVIHDELDVPFGEVRLKKGGGHAGHNGLRSLIQRMGPDFGRLRVGIGRPPASFRGEVADYVLSPFSAEEREKLPKIVDGAAKTVLDIAARGFHAAMKIRNTRPKKKVVRAPEAAAEEAVENRRAPDKAPSASDRAEPEG
jgi:peptidyl-tRNA hydrolase, PTH1 family